MAAAGIFHTSYLCPHSVKRLQTDRPTGCLFSVCLGGDTLSLLHFNDSLSSLLLPQPLCLFAFSEPQPLSPSAFLGQPRPGPVPSASLPQQGGPVQDPVLPAGSLTQTRCGFFLPFLLFPLSCPGLQGVRERRGPPPTSCSSPLPPCPVPLPSPRSEGRQCVTEHVPSASSG